MQSVVAHANPWKGASPPKKILVMRFQAMGDMVITLPYLQDLKDRYPDMEIHFLTRKEVDEIPRTLSMFQEVITIYGGRNMRLQLLSSLGWLPWLWWQRYELVIDLQNHRLSRIMRRLLAVKYWSEFDRVSPVSAGVRTQAAIGHSGIGPVSIAQKIITREPDEKRKPGVSAVIVLNPAGGFSSRSWPLENYAAFAALWLERDPHVQFLLLGLPSMKEKAAWLRSRIQASTADLTGQTTAAEAFQRVGKASLVLSEDSGLMHMAWTQRIPTVAVFGSTPSYWSAPQGAWSFCFDSSDLPCGNCFLEKCKFNDNHCLTRVTARMVFLKSIELIEKVNSEKKVNR